jgi:hypothetical protein
MAGALLRSGSLTEFHPLGAVGKPVYTAASQLRAAIRRHFGADAADLLAVPKRHDRGDVIDWYAPLPGPVVPWSAATPEERAEALLRLRAAREQLDRHAQALQADPQTSERRVFGRLLAQATRIPGDDHIYLVNGRPVITFWGFHPLDAPTGFDVIAGLTAAKPTAAAGMAAAETVTEAPAAAEAVAAGTPTDAPAGRRWWWLLPLALLLLLLLVPIGLKSCGVPVPFGAWLPTLPGLAPPAATLAPPDWRPVLDRDGQPLRLADGAGLYTDADGRRIALYPDGRRLPVAADGTPLPAGGAPAAGADSGTAVAGGPGAAGDRTGDAGAADRPPATEPAGTPPSGTPPSATPPSATPPSGTPPSGTPPSGTPPSTAPPAGTPPPIGGQAPPATTAAPPGTPLTIPPQAVQAGDTGFLDGAWRSITGLQDKAGNPIDLTYAFKAGEGPVTLSRLVGDQQQTCQGSVGSAMEGGRLTLNQGEVRCPDGTVFQKSRIVCVPDASGRARCQGINDNGSTYDVDIVK